VNAPDGGRTLPAYHYFTAMIEEVRGVAVVFMSHQARRRMGVRWCRKKERFCVGVREG
jgi:hypothetical protein